MFILFQFFIVALLLPHSLSKSASQKKSAVLDVREVTLEMNTTKTFLLKNLDEARALMVNIEYQSKKQPLNQFEMRISNKQSQIAECHFKYISNLCVLQKPSKQVNVQIKCLQNICKTKLVFSQRVIIYAGNSSFKRRLVVPGQIYRLEKRIYNTILEIYAQREEHKILSDEIIVYSNIHAFPLQQTQQLDTNSAVFGLKPIKTNAEQYVYIENRSNNNKMLKATLKSHNGELRDGISIIDFIENYGKHSHNNYAFISSLKKNIMINVRVFAPRDPKGIPLTLILKGRSSELEEQKEIRSIKFDPIDFEGHNFFDFSFALTNSVHKSFKFISFDILLHEVEDKSVFLELQALETDQFQINIFDHIYFSSLAQQQLHFTVIPSVKLELTDGDKEIKVVANADQGFSFNNKTCSLHQGCSIEIKTQKQCTNCSFSFDLSDQDTKNHIIYYQVKEGSIEGKVDLEQQIYFKYAMNGKQITQIIVNTMNVMVYANFQDYKRCKKPTAACHQFAINQENPVIVHNKGGEPKKLVVGVVGLEKTAFIVRFLNEQKGLEVKLGEKFSYLMDKEEKDLELNFVLNQTLAAKHEHIHFNLISPIHSLKFEVSNQDGQTIDSLQGYITFDKQKIRGNIFTIRISKINHYRDDFVHFTLVVNTNDVAIRLDSNTHYEKYGAHEMRIFLIEYDPSEVNAINIYTENLEKEKASMLLSIRDSKSEKVSGDATQKLLRDYEFINLDDYVQKLDLCEYTNCQLQLTITNQGNSELEQALTLIAEQSVISLDDSIWSTFQINELSTKNHFYFIPRYQNKSITILFNTDDNQLYINYRIFNTKNSINPQDWPFAYTDTEDVGRISNTQEIMIDRNDSELLDCWPTCVILVNINQANKKEVNFNSQHSVIKSYKILVTNLIIELPENMKFEFVLQNEQEKVLFIAVTKIIKYEQLTFFTYYSFGRARITASIVGNSEEYKLNKSKDFVFSDLQTVIPMTSISSIITNGMLNIESVLLKITITAITHLKMNFEYTSLLKEMYRLRMDDLQLTALKSGEQIWYQFLPERDFTLKLYRIKGFPLFKLVKCTEENYIDCFNKNKKDLEIKKKKFLQIQGQVKQNLEKQIVQNIDNSTRQSELEVLVEKSFEMSDEQCQKCIYYLWIYCFEGELQLTINLRSRSTEIELKEMSVLSEKLDFGSHNRYLINMIHGRDTTITLRLLEGSAQIAISDSTNNLFKEVLNSDDKNYKDFVINTAEEDVEEQEDEDEEKSEVENFGKLRKANQKHIFKHVHVTVTSLSQSTVRYLISYSVGQSSLYLEDGLVIQKNMVPEIPHTFFYRNQNKKERAYFTISSELESDYAFLQMPNTFSLKFYYYPDASNRLVKQIFQPQLPPQRNANYLGSTVTNVYELPTKYELLEIEILTKSYIKIIAAINHQELVYLPLGFEYMIKLHSRENLNLVIDNPVTEYLKVKVSKCDLSTPAMQYTNDDHDFKRGIFEAEVDIDRISFNQFIKTKKSSKTAHLKLIGSQDTDSLFIISVSGSSKQMRTNAVHYKPGDKGAINFSISKGNIVQVSFKPAICDKSPCNATFNYFLVVSENIEEIYGELNCAGSYFIPQAEKYLPKTKTDVIVISEKHLDKQRGEYRYQVKLQGNQAFIGVKGIADKTKDEVLYTPIEIQSLWGELQKISLKIILIGGVVLALIFTVAIIVSTKLARRGYKAISTQQ